MSKHLSQLCTLLVDCIFGHLPSHLYSLLATHGRLDIRSLVTRARCPERHVKSGLAILVHQRLVQYFAAEDDRITYFQINVRHAYELLRIGKHVQLLRGFVSKEAAEFGEQLMYQGTVSAKELRHLVRRVKLDHVNHTNGSSIDASDDSIMGTIDKEMFQQRVVVRCLDLDFVPEFDLDRKIRMETIDGPKFNGKVKGEKGKQLLDDEVEMKKRRIFNRNKVIIDENLNGRKRLHDDSRDIDQPRKQRKLNRGQGYAANSLENSSLFVPDQAHDGETPNEEYLQAFGGSDYLAVRINYDKLSVLRRNEQILRLAARALHPMVTSVFGALLKCVALRVRHCYDDDYAVADNDDDSDLEGVDGDSFALMSPAISVKEIQDVLDLPAHPPTPFKDESKNLTTRADKPTKPGVRFDVPDDNTPSINGAGRLKTGDFTSVPNVSGKTHQIDEILKMLAEHPLRFVYMTGNDRQTHWRVDFATLSREMIQRNLENLVKAKFGITALCLVRQLQKMGRVDEKMLASACILPLKEVRYFLGALQAAGLIEAQEVPKDSTRQPSKTVFLWFWDRDRTRRLVLEDTYKKMCRVLERIAVEREGVAGVIVKSERTDVQGHEEEYLTEAEKHALNEWHRREERLLVQLSRLDDTVACLRDFLPDDGSVLEDEKPPVLVAAGDAVNAEVESGPETNTKSVNGKK